MWDKQSPSGLSSRLASSLAHQYDGRQELSIKNIRASALPGVLLFVLAVMLSDLQFLDQDMEMLGLDSVLWISLAYGLSWLFIVAAPAHGIPWLMRAGSVLAAATLVTRLLLPKGQMALCVLIAFHFAIGFCVACGFYLLMSALQNAERFFAMLLITLYYGVIYLFWPIDAVSHFLQSIGSVLVMAVFLVAVFLTPFSYYPALLDAKTHPGRKGYIVLFLYLIYFILDQLNTYLDYELKYTESLWVGLGILSAVLVTVGVQLAFQRGMWHLWNGFLTLTVAGILLMIWDAYLSAEVGSYFYGLSGYVGYIAVIYLLGGAGKRNGTLRFFRVACLFTFFTSTVIPFAFMAIYEQLSRTYFAWFSFSLAVLCLIVGALAMPALANNLFFARWMDDFHKIDMDEPEQKLALEDRLDALGLTPREKQVCLLLLAGYTLRQASGELRIGYSTVNAHYKAIYRKLGINSRVELLLLLGVRPPEAGESNREYSTTAPPEHRQDHP